MNGVHLKTNQNNIKQKPIEQIEKRYNDIDNWDRQRTRWCLIAAVSASSKQQLNQIVAMNSCVFIKIENLLSEENGNCATTTASNKEGKKNTSKFVASVQKHSFSNSNYQLY